MEIKDLDIFIAICDERRNLYGVVKDHTNADYALHITCEPSFQWKDKLEYVAIYENPEGEWLVKFKQPFLEDLIQEVHKWNAEHRVA